MTSCVPITRKLSSPIAHLPSRSQTTSITLTLLFRSVGAVVFGIISDRFGRKWPLVVNLLLCAVLELGSGFIHDFKTFLAVRSLFGIAMGGVWGLAASTALENLPVEARGLASGVVQQGYAVGYLIAAVINLYLVPNVSAGWRALFWTASGISAFAALLRAVLPESAFFIAAKEAERARGVPVPNKTRVFFRETKVMLRQHWLLCIYAVLLMTGKPGRLLREASVRADGWSRRLQLPFAWLAGPVPDVPERDQGLQLARRDRGDDHRQLRTSRLLRPHTI